MGAKSRWAGQRGRQHPRWTHGGNGQWELGEPSQRHRRQLACLLLAFNVTVRSDRQGTCQGSHVAQACVGHCESSAFPSRYSVLVASGYRHNVTSISQCCTIIGLRKVRGPIGRDRGDGGLKWLKEGDWNRIPSPTGEGAAAVWGGPEGGAGDLHGQSLPV